MDESIDSACVSVRASYLRELALPLMRARRAFSALQLQTTARGLRLYLAPHIDYSPQLSLSAAIGAFDGLHMGHQELLEHVFVSAVQTGYTSCAILFDPDPSFVLSALALSPANMPALPSSLLSIEDRVGLLAAQGVDVICVVPFTRACSRRSFRSFFEDLILPDLCIREIHVGKNFCIGYQAKGNARALQAYFAHSPISFHAHALVEHDQMRVSATRLRTLIQEGALEYSAHLLTRAYFVRGRVLRGRNKGKSFGFPTANVGVDPIYTMPKRGVYLGIVEYEGSAYPAAINVGLPKSFEAKALMHASQNTSFYERLQHFVEETQSEASKSTVPAQAQVISLLQTHVLEAHLLGFSQTIYGEAVSVMFLERLRDEEYFSSPEALAQSVTATIEYVQSHIGAKGVEL